ncbi:MAG: electron transport complex subunit E [Candidatus Delongbacteria bacterium]|nr:electron transport complex subunit E [Candidatus Delongbacteria bacterium]
MNFKKEFIKGIYTENPIFRIVLGMCPTLAVSTSVENGIGMGLAASFVLVVSNILISVLRKQIPDSIRIPCYIVIIAAAVTIVEMVMAAYAPALYKSLGIFVPLIVVNCIILGRAEAFANKNGLFDSIADALGMGLGFTLALILLASIREILGNGTWMGINLLGESYNPMLIMILPPGAFIIMGLVLGFFNYLDLRKKQGE